MTPLYSTRSNWAKWHPFDVCLLKRSFKISQDDWTIINGPSIPLYHRQLKTKVAWSHNHTAAFATLKPHNYFQFQRNHWSYKFPLISSTLFSHLGVFWSHYNSLTVSNKVQITQKKVTESVCVSAVTDSTTSSLGTTFLNCLTIRCQITASPVSATSRSTHCTAH